MDNEQFKNVRYTPKTDFMTLVNLSVELFSFYNKPDLDAQKIKNFSSYFLLGKIVGKIGLFDLPFFINLQNSNPAKLQEPLKIAIGDDSRIKKFADSKMALIDFYESLLHICLGNKKEFVSFSTSSLAQSLQISRAGVVSIILSGDLPAFKIGSKYRVESSDLQAYILANRIRPRFKKQANTEQFKSKPTATPKPSEMRVKSQNNNENKQVKKQKPTGGFKEKPEEINYNDFSFSEPKKKPSSKIIEKTMNDMKKDKKVGSIGYSATEKKNKSGDLEKNLAKNKSESGDSSVKNIDNSSNSEIKENTENLEKTKETLEILSDPTLPDPTLKKEHIKLEISEDFKNIDSSEEFQEIKLNIENEKADNDLKDEENANITDNYESLGAGVEDVEDNKEPEENEEENTIKKSNTSKEENDSKKDEKNNENNDINNENEILGDDENVADVMNVVAGRVGERLAPTLPYQEEKLINKPKASVRITNKK